MSNENINNESGLDHSDRFVSVEEAARMLGLEKRYAGESIRKGFLKGKIAYRSVSGRFYKYSYADLLRVQEQATVPAKRL